MSSILSTLAPIEEGRVTIDEVVFEPKHLKALLSEYSLSADFGHDLSLVAAGHDQVAALLRAALADWVDFLFVPTPKPFLIYADHDEYSTFYANTTSNLNRVVHALSEKGFEKIQNYRR